MLGIYIPLLIIFAAFGAFCFNMGHKRAYRIVLKVLLKGQIGFLAQRMAYMNENRANLSREELSRALLSYETIGQLVIGWYKYFINVRDDKEVKYLKGQIKQSLEEYLSLIEAIGS